MTPLPVVEGATTLSVVLHGAPLLRDSLDSPTRTATMMLEKTKRHLGAMAAERMEGRDSRKKALVLEYICGNEAPIQMKVTARRVALMPLLTSMTLALLAESLICCRSIEKGRKKKDRETTQEAQAHPPFIYSVVLVLQFLTD
jgi:hypothetical protein